MKTTLIDSVEHGVVVMTRADLDAIIASTARITAEQVIAQFNPQGEDLWDADQVGTYLGLAASTVAQKIAYRRGFPSVVLGNGPKARRRWRASEVRTWANETGEKK